METHRYAVVDKSDTKVDDRATLNEAIAIAKADGNCAVLQENYEYTNSTVAWTPDGSDEWPPPTRFTIRDSLSGEWPADACNLAGNPTTVDEALIVVRTAANERLQAHAGAEVRITVTDASDSENAGSVTINVHKPRDAR